jgi:tetratricopeptide (TPR) repeat protein
MDLAVKMGRWQVARDLAPEVGLNTRGFVGSLETHLAAIDLQVGAAGDSADRIEAQILSADRGGDIRVARLGLLSNQLTGSPAVDAVLEFVTQAEDSSERVPIERRSLVMVRAMAAVIEQDFETAEALYAQLADRPGGMDPRASVANGRVLGLLSATLGRPEEAETHFRDAVEFCRKAGYRPELAWTCSDYAELLRDRNEPGDRDRAIEMQNEAIAIAQELGMKPLLERVLAQREILKA